MDKAADVVRYNAIALPAGAALAITHLDMKKPLLAVALLVGFLTTVGSAYAASYDWVWTLNDNMGSPYTFNLPGDYSPNETRVLVYSPSTHQPYLAALNGGLQIDPSNGFLVVDNIPESHISNLTADLATINTALGNKSNIGHMHAASDIGGLSTFVDARIASTSATSTPMGVQRIRVQTNASGVYTWTFPTAFPASTTPVVTVVAEDATSNAMTSAQITSISNTTVTVQVNQIAQVTLLSTLLGTGPVAVQKFVDITAVKP